MTKRTTTKQKFVTEPVLKRELTALERRIDAKIDSAEFSFKEYVDSRISPVNVSLGEMRQDIATLSKKLDTSVKGIIEMIERFIGKHDDMKEQVIDHERRITVLEARA